MIDVARQVRAVASVKRMLIAKFKEIFSAFSGRLFVGDDCAEIFDNALSGSNGLLCE